MPNDVIWKADPHTLTKIEILGRYLGAWYGILGNTYGRVFYIDAFAGPGEYQGGIDGSPIVALDKALNHASLKNREATFWFVEENAERYNHLAELINQRTIPPNFDVNVWDNSNVEAMQKILNTLAWNNGRTPTFAFIDPYGFKGVSMAQLHQLLKRPSCEIMVTHMVQFSNRFKDTPEFETHLDAFYGTRVWREAPAQGRSFLADLFRQQLEKQARFTWSFRVIDRKNQHLYDLVFATNHLTGLARMKEAMASKTLEGPYRMSDRTAWQSTLFSFWDDITPLKEQLQQAIDNCGECSSHEWCDGGLVHTDSRVKDIRHALRELALDGVLTITHRDGRPVRRGTAPSGSLIKVKKEEKHGDKNPD